MTIAKGRSISVPWSWRTNNGSNPRVAVPAVLNCARTRPMLASRTASTRLTEESQMNRDAVAGHGIRRRSQGRHHRQCRLYAGRPSAKTRL